MLKYRAEVRTKGMATSGNSINGKHRLRRREVCDDDGISTPIGIDDRDAILMVVRGMTRRDFWAIFMVYAIVVAISG